MPAGSVLTTLPRAFLSVIVNEPFLPTAPISFGVRAAPAPWATTRATTVATTASVLH
ncbi:MAG: hypothetical protein ACJ74P_05295 [Gaiellaceae bacterium]